MINWQPMDTLQTKKSPENHFPDYMSETCLFLVKPKDKRSKGNRVLCGIAGHNEGCDPLSDSWMTYLDSDSEAQAWKFIFLAWAPMTELGPLTVPENFKPIEVNY